MSSRQAMIVARREFLERVRTKWFAIVTLLGPIGMIAAIVIPAYLSVRSVKEGFKVQLVDQSERDIGAMMNVDLDAQGVAFKIESVPADTPFEVLEKRIRDEQIDGYLVLPKDVLTGGTVEYRGDNATNMMVTKGLARLVDFAVFRARGMDMGLDELSSPVYFKMSSLRLCRPQGRVRPHPERHPLWSAMRRCSSCISLSCSTVLPYCAA